MIILAEITPYDPVGAAEITLRFSSAGPVPVFDGKLWRSRIKSNLSLGLSIFENEFISASAQRTAGTLQLAIGDGELDQLTAFHWDQRGIKIWTGEGDNFADFTLRFQGFVRDMSFDEATLTLALGDKSNIFDQPVDFPTYTGAGYAAGDYEGPAELKDTVKPWAFGPIFNMEPVLVDSVDLVYQAHCRAVQSIDGVFDQGVALTADGDTTDLAAWSPLPGRYKTDLSRGLFRLGAKPAGLVTVDLKGDAAGGYVATAGDIIKRLLDFIPDSSQVTVDAAAFTALNGVNSAACSLHARSAENASTLFSALMRGVGGYWMVNWLGSLTVGIIDFTAPQAEISARNIKSLVRLETPPPVWRLKTTYHPNWRVQNSGEIAQGPAGVKWLTGAGAPLGALGEFGDFYIDLTSQEYFEKTALTTWTSRGYIKGDAGQDGAPGASGADGVDGVDGKDALASLPIPFAPGVVGGAADMIITLDMNADGTINPGEIRIQGSRFIHPDGVERSVQATSGIWTPYGDGLSAGRFYLMWTDTVRATRFPTGSWGGAANIVPIRVVGGVWKAFDNDDTDYALAIVATDCILAVVEAESVSSGLTAITPFVSGAAGLDGAQGPQGPQGADGAQGPQGIQGPTGPQGQATYVWIAYADSADGVTNFTNGAPGGRTYIGVAYNKTVSTESADAADYAWSLVKGADGTDGAQGPQGIQGPAGSDGQSLYTWIAYADSADGTINFTNGAPGGRTYIGLAYNKTVSTESSNPADYDWSRIGGEGNLIDVTQWTVGTTGSQGDFLRNGLDAENEIVLGAGPYGATEPLWKMSSDGLNDGDGGWNHNNIPIDNKKSYRLTVWAMQTSTNGTIYLGCSAAGGSTLNLSGTVNGNPYFWNGDLPTLNKWYLIVGVIHGSDYTGADTGHAGVYDPETAEKVITGTEYKNAVGATAQVHRAYQYYATVAGVTAYFSRPRFDELNGNEPSLQSLFIAGRPGRYTDFKFYLAATKPGTPTGEQPVGWQDVPGAGTTWVSRAIKNGDGTIQTPWTDPELYKADYRGVYSAVATYYLGQTVSYQDRFFICTSTNSAGISGVAPPATNASNSVWDLISGKGDSGDPPTAFTSSATHSSGSAVNMRNLADSMGYDGQSDANFTVTVSSSITATSGGAIDTGSWPAAQTINLTLNINSGVIIRGAGGAGGGGGGLGAGGNGGNGGHGVTLNEDLTLVNNGTISGGSGGGGGGGGYRFFSSGEYFYRGGGGGGGGWPNGAGGSGGTVPDAYDGSAGSPGTISGGGAGGAGAAGGGAGRDGGGVTGITPQAGTAGQGATFAGGTGGGKGAGIKKNGHTLSLSGSGSNSGIGA